MPEGARFGEYVLGKRIGRGAYGEVHAGWHPRTQTKVAIKLEDAARRVSRMPIEVEVYQQMQGVPGFGR